MFKSKEKNIQIFSLLADECASGINGFYRSVEHLVTKFWKKKELNCIFCRNFISPVNFKNDFRWFGHQL